MVAVLVLHTWHDMSHQLSYKQSLNKCHSRVRLGVTVISHIVTMVSLQCCSGVAVVLQWGCRGIIIVMFWSFIHGITYPTNSAISKAYENVTIVSQVSQWCYVGITMVSQLCYSGVTMVFWSFTHGIACPTNSAISEAYQSVTMVSQKCHNGVTVVLQWCYSGVTGVKLRVDV
jgi:CBS domain containing-hemolysin-like protein